MMEPEEGWWMLEWSEWISWRDPVPQPEPQRETVAEVPALPQPGLPGGPGFA